MIPTPIEETTNNPAFDDDAINRLRTTFGRISRRLDRRSGSEDGLTRSQGSLLATIARFDTISVRELADIEGLNPTMLSRMLGKFEDAGLLTRAPDPDDKRVVHVHITGVGTDRFMRIRGRRIELITEQLAELSPDHLAALRQALPALEELAAGMDR